MCHYNIFEAVPRHVQTNHRSYFNTFRPTELFGWYTLCDLDGRFYQHCPNVISIRSASILNQDRRVIDEITPASILSKISQYPRSSWGMHAS